MHASDRRRMFAFFSVTVLAAAAGCAREEPPPQKDPVANVQPAPNAPSPPKGTLQLGAPIAQAAPTVALVDIAQHPAAYMGKTITTSGTVTSVCQHKGCWMEIRDDASQAHIKMAGHSFFVPKTAAGHKARVQATLVGASAKRDDGDDAAHERAECDREAAQQMGRPLAKLQLEASGVELD